MIQLTKKLAAPAPAVLITNGNPEIENLKARYDAGEREFMSTDFHNTIYGHTDVKEALINLQDGKCAFCESKIRHISHGDVEHYRPKTGWVQDQEALNKPGYYWLAYDWSNLILSCQICNQRHKKNYFPLVDPSQRVLSHNSDLHSELPVFIHPVFENPQLGIGFKEEIPVALNGSSRGKATIEKLGLDRETLNDMRRSELNILRALYEVASLFPLIPEDKCEAAWAKVRKIHDECLLDNHQYSSMYRAFFIQNPLPPAV